MPVYSTVTITFVDDFEVGTLFQITNKLNNVLTIESWNWEITRISAYQVTKGTPTATAGERTAINFKAAFDLDNPTGYITGQSSNTVTLQSETIGFDFIQVQAYDINDISMGSNFWTASFSNYTAPGQTVSKTKYYISYCDDFNTSRNVFIEKKDWTGGGVELLADVNPISISYESSDDFKFSPIRPSVAEVFMIFDSEGTVDFEEFWTADEKDFLVKDVKEGVVEWSGYVIPNGFQYEFRGGLYHASIQASDGLGTLEAIPFVDDNNKPYGPQDLVYNNEFEFPFTLIITEILRKLELDLDLWTCVDSYEKTMTKVGDLRIADPLSASYVNVKTYIKEGENKEVPYWYGSGEVWNCKDVMENVLYIFGAKLYQEFGVWRVKTINADIDYGTGATQRYWRKYNTAGTYLENYETVDDEINIPCDDGTKYLLGNDHSMSMDDVYKSFRMNYIYQFIREGDTPFELITNGSFCDFNNTSVLAEPEGWIRWRYSTKWYIRIKDITIPFADAGGNTCGIEVGTHKVGIPLNQPPIYTDPNPAIWTSLRQNDLSILKNEQIHLSLWAKYRAIAPNGVFYQTIYKMVLEGEDGKVYYLRNNQSGGEYKLGWQSIPNRTALNYNYLYDAHFFYLTQYLHGKDRNFIFSNSYIYFWYNFDVDIAPAPISGTISFAIHGLSASEGRETANFPAFPVWGSDGLLGEYKTVSRDWIDEGGDIPRPQFTGISLGIIPNESESPQQQDYIYKNENTDFTLQTDPIKIYNGDLQNEKHISNIIVPTNTTGGKNFWDDLSGAYGTSSLGLLTVREIMRQYQKPYRILEGDVKIQDARFGSVYTFSVLPTVRFILQRGTFNKQKQYIENATFVQLTSDVLPDGGSEGGDTLDPEWTPTGVSFCQVINFLNTGYVVIEEEDINPNSETYQEIRFPQTISVAQDLTQCPLNQPRKYYWGSDDIYLNTDTLSYAPFTQVNPKEIQINFSNLEGNYLYFVHLKQIGGVGQLVERIYTLTTPNNVLADWVYLADRIIDGYIYRVLRTDYVMTEFTGFTHNLVFA